MNPIPWYDLNWFDYAMIGIVVMSVLVSFFRGFVREAVSLSIWTVGLILAFKLSPLLETHIHRITHWGMMSYLIAFAVIFLAVWIVGLLISLALRSVISGVGLGFVDRMVGVCFGAIRGVLVVSVMLMFVSMSPFKHASTIQASRIAPEFHKVIAMLDHYVPQDMQRLTQWAAGGN